MRAKSRNLLTLNAWLLAVMSGCAGVSDRGAVVSPVPAALAERLPAVPAVAVDAVDEEDEDVLRPVSLAAAYEPADLPAARASSPEEEPLPGGATIEPDGLLTLEDVLQSVYASYPLLESSLYERDIAYGNHLAAHGGFDLKLKASSENGPVGFYETYRQSVGLVQPLYSGSELWGGYRVGRGDFQPWYLERQTNDGGEFKAGLTVPLARNRAIDDRRAELWRTDLGLQLAEFDIQAQIIGFVQEASYAYWDWVAAGQMYAIAERVLQLADERTDRIKRQVEAGLIDPPELTDNQRLIAERRAKLAESRRKLQQTSAKLSLFLRDAWGQPILPMLKQAAPFPDPEEVTPDQLRDSLESALRDRPELQLLATVRGQLEIDLAQARNELQPDVSAVVWGAQDVGAPASSKRDKSPFELEAGVYVDVPVQRRKAMGKVTAVEAKLQQLAAKQHLTADKIGVEVRMAHAALVAAWEQVLQTRDAVRLAEELAQRERRSFENGASDLLKVTLREQYAAESAVKEIEALLLYHQARADYHAAIARLPMQDAGGR